MNCNFYSFEFFAEMYFLFQAVVGTEQRQIDLKMKL